MLLLKVPCKIQVWCVGVFFLSSCALSAAQASKRDTNVSPLHEAARAITAGELNHAENELDAVLHSAPDEHRALDLLGVVRVLQRRDADAEQLFRHAIQKEPGFAPAHAHLGLLCVQMGRPEEAVPELREALRIDPARIDASAALVHILQEQARAAGGLEQALALLIDARKYEPDNPDVQFELGMTALRMSLLQDAINAFQQTLKLRENDSIAIYNLGCAFGRLARFEDARQQFVRYIEIRPDDPSGYSALGITLAALARSGEARTQFERSIELAPAQTESYFRLGLLDLDSKDFDSATKNLQHVLDRDPKHAEALTALGRVAFEQKRYTEAMVMLQRALANNNSLREAHYYLGLTFARVGREQESDEQLQIAVQLEHSEVEKRRSVYRTLDPAVGVAQKSQPQK